MKSEVIAVAAAIAGVASAGSPHARRHENLHLERGLLINGTGTGAAGTCGVSTIYSVITGAPQLYFPPEPTPYVANVTSVASVYSTEAVSTTSISTSAFTSASTSTATPVVTSSSPIATIASSSAALVPTPYATTIPSPGTYTIPATTITLTAVTTVWTPSETTYPAGTYTQPEVVVTVTDVNYVVYCPFATSTSAAAVSSSAPVVYVSTTPVAISVASPTSAVAVSTVASSAVSTSTSTSGGGEGTLGSSSDQWAMCYTPYNPTTGDCLSAAEVLVDITLIKAKGFKAIRMYSSSEGDCSGLENIGAAAKAVGLNIIVGIWIGDTGISGASEQVSDLLAWGNTDTNWDLVEGCLVGNEAINSKYVTASELATFISTVKSQLTSAGYKGGVSTTEPLDAWQASTSELCDVVDWVGVNLHAFFNADCEPSNAGPFVLSELTIADGLCPGKTAWNMETGWPSYSSECNGVACGNSTSQATAIASIKSTVGGRAAIFSYSNDLWKAAGDFGCEQSWGCIDLF